MPPAIDVRHLSKSFAGKPVVRDVSIAVQEGRVTGFLGPNGSGKTTTLRMVLGLVRPTAGRTLVGDRPYAQHHRPGRVVGAALEASGFHPGRSGLDHLRAYAPQVGVSDARCREVVDLVGLSEAAHRRVSGYSMGMRQRLALATALLTDPPTILLDEPANGLDPEGIVWLREFLRHLAAEGRSVLVSSHVLGEVQHTVDDVVVIAQGRLVHASSLAALADLAEHTTYVEGPDRRELEALLHQQGWAIEASGAGWLVHGVEAPVIGAAAHVGALELHALTPQGADLEDVFLRLTAQAPAPAGDRS